MWPNDRLINLFDIELPIIQAPMAGSAFSEMAIAVSEAGGLGSLACGLLSVEQARREARNNPTKDIASHPAELLLPPRASRRRGSRNNLETTLGCLLHRTPA